MPNGGYVMKLNKTYALLSLVLLTATSFLVRAGLVLSEGRFLQVSGSSIHQGDLIISGNINYTIVDQRFDINGSIIVEENATLYLRNAVINFTQTRNYQFKMCFEKPSNGNPRLHAINSTLTSNFILYVDFYGNSSAMAREDTFNCRLEAFDSSTVNVFSSTVEDLWAFESSVVTVANSTITSRLHGSYSATISASNCRIREVDTWGRPNINISNSNITDYVKPCFGSVNSSVAGLKPGLFQSWNSLQDCSVVEAAEGFAPNITLLNSQVAGWHFRFRRFSNATVYNSELHTLDSADFSAVSVYNSTITNLKNFDSSRSHFYNTTINALRSQHDSRLWLVNSTSNTYSIYDQSEVYVSWHLDVHVVDSIGQDVPSANVTATYPNATVAESKLTDENGRTRLILMEKMMNATGEHPIGNYTVTAEYEVYMGQESVNMTGNQEIIISLPFIIPEFPKALLLPILIIITIGVAVSRGSLVRRKLEKLIQTGSG